MEKCVFFFFSSRRRHTRFKCDWSSDVCSSDLRERNAFVDEHARAQPQAGLKQLQDWVRQHRLNRFVTLTLQERGIDCSVDAQAMADDALLDGCYTLETNVSKAHLDAASVDA